MEVFSAHVRDEVDLGALADDLLDVIGETMHPVHASLWLSGAPHVLAPRRRPSAVAALPPRGAES